MGDIRVTYSGLISVTIGFITMITGLAFFLILTRTLDTIEFGTWGVVTVLFLGVLQIEPIISYWATRETARGLESTKTAIFATGIFSSFSVIIYLIIIYFVESGSKADSAVLFAVILIPIMFLNRVLSAISLGWKPQAVSYGQLAVGVTQIPMALIFVYLLDMGLIGVIISVAIANTASIIILTISIREKIKNGIEIKFLKKWFRLSWLPFYPGISGMIHTYDVVIFSLFVGSVEGIAFWTAAIVLPTLVTNSGLISVAVYAKLLKEGKMDNLKKNITQIFFFAFPLSAIVIVFAQPGLFILNPIYQIAYPVVIIMTFQIVLSTLSNVFQSLIKGVETVDANENSTFKQYIKSKLFFLPTLILIQYSAYIILLIIMLWIFSVDTNTIDLITYWALIALAVQIPITACHYIMVRKNLNVKFEKNIIVKYFVVALVVFSLIYFVSEQFLEYDNNIFIFVPKIILLTVIGISGYILITYLIDNSTKKLVSAIINELKQKFD